VEGITPEALTSTGYFIQITAVGDTGQVLEKPYAVLFHESGWEWWFQKILETLVKKGVDAFVEFCRKRWPDLHRRGSRIDHVEVRTRSKGIGRIAFSLFDPIQIECLAKKFDQIESIHDLNDSCFGGMLIPVGEEND
jgi:hypothetical protein